jgi:hypothetical protein
VAERKIRVREPKWLIVSVRLTGRDLAEARMIAKRMTKGNVSALLRHALLRLVEEEKNVLH